jgi:hypothetical protein
MVFRVDGERAEVMRSRRERIGITCSAHRVGGFGLPDYVYVLTYL